MNIQQYLKATGLTQKAFGDKVGVTQGMVWQWVSNFRPVSPEMARKIELITDRQVTAAELCPRVFGSDDAILAQINS